LVSDEILDFWFMIIGIIVACTVIITAVWVLDRSRRHTPAYALGRAMQDAWAALQAHRIKTGQAKPMPTTVEGLEGMALQSLETQGFDPRVMGAQTPEEALAQKAEALAKQKEQLDQQAPPTQ